MPEMQCNTKQVVYWLAGWPNTHANNATPPPPRFPPLAFILYIDYGPLPIFYRVT